MGFPSFSRSIISSYIFIISESNKDFEPQMAQSEASPTLTRCWALPMTSSDSMRPAAMEVWMASWHHCMGWFKRESTGNIRKPCSYYHENAFEILGWGRGTMLSMFEGRNWRNLIVYHEKSWSKLMEDHGGPENTAPALDVFYGKWQEKSGLDESLDCFLNCKSKTASMGWLKI